jgi:hypothetical protein
VSDPSRSDSPGRGIWLAWSLAFVGGLAVIGAVMLALYHPCLRDGQALATDGCSGAVSPTLVVALTGVGTVLAVIGGIGATAMTLRRTRR